MLHADAAITVTAGAFRSFKDYTMLSAAVRRTCLLVAAVVSAASPTLLPIDAASAATRCPPPSHVIVRSAPGAGKTVALTFDDGPGSFTPPILAILRKYDVRATFFDTGRHDAQFPRYTREIAAEGHLLGDHTWAHDYPGQVPGGWTRAYLLGQFDRTNSQQLRLTGHRTCFFRPPGGYDTPGMVAAAASRGMSTVMWSVDTQDWKQPARTTTAAVNRIVANARPGLSQRHPIVLMHTAKASHEPESQVSSNRSNDLAALPRIIAMYRSHGYRFVDMLGRSGLPPEPTTLSTTSGTMSATAGVRTEVLRGTLESLTGPAVGRHVRWYSRPVGTEAWRYRGGLLTGPRGGLRLVVASTADTQYRLRYRGSSRYAAATSRIRTVHVVAAPGSATGAATVTVR